MESPSSVPALSWHLAIIIVVLGTVSIGAGILKRSNPPIEDNAKFEKDIADREARVEALSKRAREATEAGLAKANELNAKRQEIAALSMKLNQRTAEVRQLEELNGKKIAELREQMGVARNQASQDIDAANKLLREAAGREQIQKAIQQTAEKFKNAVVTIECEDGSICSGFFVGGFNVPICVCTTAQGKRAQAARIKLRYKRNDADPEYSVAVGRAQTLAREVNTGLTVLTFTFQDRITINTVSLEMIAAIRQGDAVLTISSQVAGGELMENNVYDGVVSATSRKLGDVNVVQTSIPSNPGSTGSPVFNANGVLAGVLLGQFSDMERVSAVIPASALVDLLKSLEKK
ncbi:MAG TPA: trypsin-like peptidase domain-containing protein [Planctomycetota bacterium]|nr:trypsin-like peptidase domain-containing protein [Planctomycetota bacterium]